jgi:hypothetical protein
MKLGRVSALMLSVALIVPGLAAAKEAKEEKEAEKR